MFDVTVKTLDGRDSVFQVGDEDMTVENFKKEIEERLNIASDQQRLIFQGRVLNNEQTLTECGVQGKVVHLVVRPPPTTREHQPTVTSTNDSTANIGGSGLGGFTFGGISMQQAIQDITSGILNSVNELRVANIPLSGEADLVGDPPNEQSLISARENTFNKLHRQATRLAQKITQTSSRDVCNSQGVKDKPADTNLTPSTSNNTSVFTVQEPKDDETTFALNDMKEDCKQKESSPMMVDTDEHEETANRVDNNDADGDESKKAKTEDKNVGTTEDNSANPSQDRSLAMLADMLSRYCELWHSMEPYLDQWRQMLIDESKIVEVVDENDITDEEECIGESSSSSSANVQVQSSSNQPVSNWRPRLFSQVSRLLHLNAHMLHLISDFDVITVTERETQQVDSNISTSQQNNVPSDSTQKTTTTANESQKDDSEKGKNATTEATRKELKSSTPQVNKTPQHVLCVPEMTDRRRIRARINVEPSDVTIVATSTDEQQPRLVRSEQPTNSVNSSSARFRSRSASNIRRSNNSQSQNVPLVTSSSGITANSGVTTTTPLGNGRTAIIHRFDIPIISVNTFNLPTAPFLASLSSSATSTPVTSGPTSVSSATTTTRPPAPPPTATTTTPTPITVTTDSLPPSHANVTLLPRPSIPPPPPLPPLSVINSSDQFLMCNSRHFSHEVIHRVGTSQGLLGPPPLTPIPDAAGGNVNRQNQTQTTTANSTTGRSNNTSHNLPGFSTHIPFSFGESIPPTSVPNNSSATTTTNTGNTESRTPGATFSFTSGFNLPQQLISLVTAATNAAVSAVSSDQFTTGGGGGTSPFSFLVSSSPIQFTVNASPQPIVTTISTRTTTTATGAATAGAVTSNNTSSGANQGVDSRAQTTTTTMTTSATRTSSRVVSRVTPSWATPDGVAEQQLQLDGIFRIFSVIIDGLIRTVWSRVSQSSAYPIPACQCVTDQNSIGSSISRHQNISAGLLNDILNAVRGEVHAASDTTTDVSGHVTAAALDGLRDHLQHLLLCADSVTGSNQSELVNSLVSTIFRGRLSDACHSEYTLWINNFDENSSQKMIDVTASFAKLCRYIISSQLDLWRASPTNTGFGSTLLMTLKIACTDLLCLADLLTTRLASNLKIELSKTSKCSSGETRSQIFGIGMGFETLMDHCNSFLQDIEDDECFDLGHDFVTGLNNCIQAYCDMDEATIRAKVAHQISAYMEFRKQASQTPSPMLVDPSNGEIQRNNFCDEDLHGDDLPFLDAYSDPPSDETNHTHPPISLQLSTPSTTTTASKENNKFPSSQLKLQAKISALPDWSPKPGELPNSKLTALDPNPNSTLSMEATARDSNEAATAAEGWHAVLPPAWIHVVTGDMSTMSRNPPESDDPDQFGRFSDGYIAGMPAKRRKVMQDHSGSIYQSPDQLFMECLSDAVAASDNVVGNKEQAVEEKNSPELRRLLPSADKELINSFRDIVSDRLTVRLINDPDFDAVQFPTATQTFVRKDSKPSS
uniref:Ubiquitin-like domain-containing protein n=2 Tax=Trichobilharzia regenti TaxID=157069 RepID=A0AA85JUK6_TRIRE|nr:unnamed protein product [Trichobilharzia regenti]